MRLILIGKSKCYIVSSTRNKDNSSSFRLQEYGTPPWQKFDSFFTIIVHCSTFDITNDVQLPNKFKDVCLQTCGDVSINFDF
jgi:hypothetical protein